MTSSALKGQKIAKRKKPANAGKLLEAANELRTALETIQHSDAAAFLKVFAKAEAGKYSAAADPLGRLVDAAVEYSSVHLMNATDEAVELLAEITDGVEPTEGNMTGGARDAAWSKLRQALQLKNWPANAIDEVIDVATDTVGDGCYAEVFGYSYYEPAPVLDPAADARAAAIAEGATICHGCPGEEEPGVEADPRGFPGLLCAACADKARRDVATGHADLGPLATDEAKAKAAEVEADYRAKTGAGVTP